QARSVLADGGTTLIVGSLSTSSPTYQAGSNGNSTVFGNSFTNELGAAANYLISLTTTDAPAGWQSHFTFDGNDYNTPTEVGIDAGIPAGVDVTVSPDATPGIGTYLLTVASVDDPGAPIIEQEFHVISGVHDLVVTNPQAEPHDVLYMDGLSSEP